MDRQNIVGINSLQAFIERELPVLVCYDLTTRADGRVVYFIRNYETDLIKIGTTRNLRYRVKQINKAEGTYCQLLIAIPGDRQVEKELHRAFADTAICEDPRNEWFYCSSELYEFITDMRVYLYLANRPLFETCLHIDNEVLRGSQ